VGKDALQGIDVRGGSTFSLAKKEDGWRLVEPLDEQGDDPTVTGIVRALQDLRATRFAAEKVDDPAKFGLAEPALSVTLRRGGGDPIELAFGQVDDKVYARNGDGPVLEVAGSILGSIDKTVEELRDKRLFRFASDAAHRVRFAGEGGDIEVERRGEDWFVVAPEEAKAKAKEWKMDAIVSMVRDLRAKRFVEGKPGEYGLEAPRRTVTVLDQGGKELAKLLVGRKASALAYVQAAGAARIAEIDSPRLSHLPAELADLKEPKAEQASEATGAANE
jgi:hypothetical protein